MNQNAMYRGAFVLSLGVGAFGLAACWSAKIELTGDDAGAAISASGSSGASGSGQGTAPSAECFADAGLVDGSGYSGLVPAACSSALGAPLTFGSPADVASVITGRWFACDGGSFFSVLKSQVVDGVEITADGHVNSLNIDGETKLAGQSDFSPYFGTSSATGFDPESKNTQFGTASYTVVDASAALGAGTFQLRMTATDGTIEQPQILVYNNPDRIQLVLGNQSTALARAVTFQYRAGICSPAFPGGTALAARVFPFTGLSAGRWIWCGGEGNPLFGYGFDIESDGTVLKLYVDSNGNLAPTPLPAGQITPPSTTDAGLYFSPDYSDLEGANIEVGTCPAALGIVNSSTNYSPGGFYQPIPPQ